jgi:kinesin family member 6/9
LLSTSSKGSAEGRGEGLEALPKISMLEDEHGNFHIKNLSMHPASSEEEALDLLFIGDTNRAVAETPMNPVSSLAVCLFIELMN